MDVCRMSSGCACATQLRERARVWHNGHAQGSGRADRDVHLFACGECDVVLCEVSTCHGDLQLGAWHERELDIDRQASSRVHTTKAVPGQFSVQGELSQAPTEKFQKARLFEKISGVC
jgi:hypothetical protein